MNTHVNFEIAKLLKEKGFDIGFGNGQKFYFPDTKELTENYRGNNYPAPTISEVVMWLYEKHEIWIGVDIDINGKFRKFIRKYNIKDRSWDIKNYFLLSYDYESPTEVYQSAIEYTLNNLI